MIDFFNFSSTSLIFIALIIGFCVLAQTLALVLRFFRHGLTTLGTFKILLELFILLEIFNFSLLYGQMLNGYNNGIAVPSGYENIRIPIFLIICILVLIVFTLKKNLLVLSVIPATMVSLPIMEIVLGAAYPWFFLGAIIFFLSRSIKICKVSAIDIRTSISSLSVMHAINTLPTGVLFSENDGYTILSNYQMQNLMIAITGKVFRNAIEFYKALLSGKYDSRYKKAELEGKIVYLLDDGTAWMFTRTDIYLLMKNYIHISVADISQLWEMTTKLQLQDQEIVRKSNELKETIVNLHILSKQREIDNAKMRAHDILGQRLTVILRIIQNEDNLDYDLLISLTKGLLAELKAEQSETSPQDELKSIQQIFAAIGVDIKFEGDLPETTKEARLFVDIIREASTNAVRHGFATKINIKSEKIWNNYYLKISNNGHVITTPIIPGSGIRVIRKKISTYNGTLDIMLQPLFTLSIVIPGGDRVEEGTNCR